MEYKPNDWLISAACDVHLITDRQCCIEGNVTAVFNLPVGTCVRCVIIIGIFIVCACVYVCAYEMIVVVFVIHKTG